MTTITFRGNTQQDKFPLLSDLAARTVIISQYDQTYIPGVSPNTDKSASDKGIPNLYYGEDIFPSETGVKSITYKEVLSPPDGVTFTEIYEVVPASWAEPDGDTVYDAYQMETTNKHILMGWDSSTGYIWFLQDDGTWYRSPYIQADSSPISVTSVNGTTVVFTPGGGNNLNYLWFVADNDTNVDDNYHPSGYYTLMPVYYPGTGAPGVSDGGLDWGNIVGILTSNGYLIGYSQSSITWSSSDDPFDFDTDTDVDNGAGTGNIQELRGVIIVGRPTSQGFILYASGNCISVFYTSNISYPFKFKALPNSGGITDASQVVSRPEDFYQYAYTSNGLQRITNASADNIYPEITDFLRAGKYESYNTTTKEIDLSTISSKSFYARVTSIAGRFVVISYGTNIGDYIQAIVLDLDYSRWGKINKPHSLVWELSNSIEHRYPIGLLGSDGNLYEVVMDIFPVEDGLTYSGIAIFGKYQLARDYMTRLDKVVLDVIVEDSACTCGTRASLDGKTLYAEYDGYAVTPDGNSRKFLFDATAVNHSLILKGAFDIISPVLTVSSAGKVL